MMSKLDGEVEGLEVNSHESEIVKLKTVAGDDIKAGGTAKLKNREVEESTFEGREVESVELIKTKALKM